MRPLNKKSPAITLFAMIIVLVFSLFVRIYQLENNPPGLFADEAAIGYNAYLISHSARDEYGTFLPLFFKSFGEYKGSLPIYLTSPFVYSDLNEFNTRLPFAIIGAGIVLLIFAVGKTYFDQRFGIIAAFFAAATPWLIHYSRTAFELNFYLFFFLLIIYLFNKTKDHPIFITLALLVTGLSLYTYRAAFIQIPILLLFLTITYRKILLKHLWYFIAGILILITTTIPFTMHMTSGDGLVRYNQIATLSKDIPISEKAIKIVDTYLYHFSPNFLFTKGDDFFVSRHFSDGLYPLMLIFLPFLILGLISIVKNFKSAFSRLCLLCLIIYPLPGSLTVEPPYTSRSIIGSVIFVLIITRGFVEFIDYKKSFQSLQVLKVISILLCIFVSVFYFLLFYFVKYPKISADYWGWQYGPKEIISYFNSKEDVYDQLLMTSEFNEPEIFFNFYIPDDECTKCIIGFPHERYDSSLRQLFAITPMYIQEHPEYNYVVKHQVIYPNSEVAFEIVEIVE